MIYKYDCELGDFVGHRVVNYGVSAWAMLASNLITLVLTAMVFLFIYKADVHEVSLSMIQQAEAYCKDSSIYKMEFDSSVVEVQCTNSQAIHRYVK